MTKMNRLYNTLNYASTANIEKVMGFYNLGNKSFETDFSLTLSAHTKKRFASIICG